MLLYQKETTRVVYITGVVQWWKQIKDIELILEGFSRLYGPLTCESFMAFHYQFYRAGSIKPFNLTHTDLLSS